MHDILVRNEYVQIGSVYEKVTKIGKLTVQLTDNPKAIPGQWDCKLYLESRPGYVYDFYIHGDVSDEERYNLMRQHAYQLFQMFN